ncbi:MAG: NADAR family protein [Cytophagia bacterium]|nr:NADAR family protein [Cytophagia bacterium]
MKHEFTINSPMPPLWIMYPYITQFSLGWRMGAGEGYKFDLHDWLNTLTEVERKKYFEMFPKPGFWHDKIEGNYYEGVALWPQEKKYTIENLLSTNADSKPEYLFFWKPQPALINESCLGQWQPSYFYVDLDKYCCAEQYMMAEKARLFNDEAIEEKIMLSVDPREIKALGKQIKKFDQETWDKVKLSIVLSGNYYKFTQNKNMLKYLLSTDNQVLVEASPLDHIWGIGLPADSAEAKNPDQWQGQNLLGFALMQLRDDLRKVYQHADCINWTKLTRYGGRLAE